MKKINLFIVIIALAATWLMGTTPGWASEAIVNSEVAVDVTGKDASDARTQAMAKAEIDALKDLLEKLTPQGQAPLIIASMDARKISNMVKGTEVLEEKISGNRYTARLIVSFDGDELSDLVSKVTEQAALDPTSTVSSFLIIPAYEEGKYSQLWEEDNPWRSVWRSVGLETTSGDIIVPYGDARDSAILDKNNLATATYGSMVPMTIRYGVSDIIVLQAKLVRQPDLILSVIKRRVTRGKSEVQLLTYRADPQETRELLLLRAARDIASNLQQKKSEEVSTQTVRGGERNKVMMLASISTLGSWTQLRSKLSGLPMVDRVELLAMSPKQVDMVVHYRGEADSLGRAIESQHIRLVKNKDYWVVSRD
jgi:hypothetical protein